MFSIVVENFSSPHYFSEKIMNPLLFETVPLYYGATRIEDYFPGQSIQLTGEIGDDLRTMPSVASQRTLQSWEAGRTPHSRRTTTVMIQLVR